MMYSPSARLAELVSTHLNDFFEAVEKEHVQVRSIVACGVGGWIVWEIDFGGWGWGKGSMDDLSVSTWLDVA